MQKPFYICFITILFSLINGCLAKTTPDISTIPILTATPVTKDALSSYCKAPCWNDLIPGRTTVKEVDAYLNKISAKEWPGKVKYIYPSECINYFRTDINGPVANNAFGFYIDNDILVLVVLLPQNHNTLKEIVKKYGSPEFVRPVLIKSPEGGVYDLTIFYPKKGIGFIVGTTGYRIGEINPEMKVIEFLYFQPGNMIDYYTMFYACTLTKETGPERAKKEVETDIFPWPGFVDIQPVETR